MTLTSLTFALLARLTPAAHADDAWAFGHDGCSSAFGSVCMSGGDPAWAASYDPFGTVSPSVYTYGSYGNIGFYGTGGSPGVAFVTSGADGSDTNCRLQGWSSYGLDVVVDAGCHSNGSRGAAFMAYTNWANPSQDLAYAYADKPTASRYNPTIHFSTPRAAVTVTRRATGSYKVSFDGLVDPSGIPIVSVVGNAAATCNVASWSASGTGIDVQVRCYGDTAAAADAPFTIGWTVGGTFMGGSREIGSTLGFYAYADQASPTAAYTPTQSWSSLGNTGMSVRKTGKGSYTVSLLGVTETWSNAEVLLTAVGSTATYCAETGAGFRAGALTRMDVRCYIAGGKAADSAFVIMGLTDAD